MAATSGEWGGHARLTVRQARLKSELWRFSFVALQIEISSRFLPARP